MPLSESDFDTDGQRDSESEVEAYGDLHKLHCRSDSEDKLAIGNLNLNALTSLLNRPA